MYKTQNTWDQEKEVTLTKETSNCLLFKKNVDNAAQIWSKKNNL